MDGTHRYGDNHQSSIITQAIADEIRATRGTGTRKQRAEQFNVKPSLVGTIDVGACWSKT
jgi:hypothetical protein